MAAIAGGTRTVADYPADVQYTEPDVRPLGALALGAAILSFALSVTYVYSPLAYLAAVVALPLGLISRTHERSRRLGTVAVALTVIAILAATAILIRM